MANFKFLCGKCGKIKIVEAGDNTRIKCCKRCAAKMSKSEITKASKHKNQSNLF